jgi:hypothetical protein
MRRPCSFRESDVRRTIKAARASGIEIARFEIDRDGRIVVVLGKPVQTVNENEAYNEWNDVA